MTQSKSNLGPKSVKNSKSKSK